MIDVHFFCELELLCRYNRLCVGELISYSTSLFYIIAEMMQKLYMPLLYNKVDIIVGYIYNHPSGDITYPKILTT